MKVFNDPPYGGRVRFAMLSAKRLAAGAVLLAALASFTPPGTEGWEVFARVKFVEKFFKAQNEYYLVPQLDAKIKALEGKFVTLRGHYIPMELDKGTIMLSKFPYSQCFFCGGAGPESVAEIVFAEKPPSFKADQLITITGILKLNDSDVTHMNFILRNAKLLEK